MDAAVHGPHRGEADSHQASDEKLPARGRSPGFFHQARHQTARQAKALDGGENPKNEIVGGHHAVNSESIRRCDRLQAGKQFLLLA